MEKINVPDIAEAADQLLNDLNSQGFADTPILGLERNGEWTKDYACFSCPYPDSTAKYFNEDEFLNDLADHIVEYFFTDDNDVEVDFTDDVVEIRRVNPPANDHAGM